MDDECLIGSKPNKSDTWEFVPCIQVSENDKLGKHLVCLLAIHPELISKYDLSGFQSFDDKKKRELINDVYSSLGVIGKMVRALVGGVARCTTCNQIESTHGMYFSPDNGVTDATCAKCVQAMIQRENNREECRLPEIQ